MLDCSAPRAHLVRRADLDEDADYLPVSLADMWRQLRLVTEYPAPVDFATPEDADIMLYVASITDHLQGVTGWLGRVLTLQTWTLYLPTLSGRDRVSFPLPPLRSVVGVTYTDVDGAEQDLAPEAYTATVAMSAKDMSTGYLTRVPATPWPDMTNQERGVGITFTAGYDEGECPAIIQAYIRMAAATLFENRESVVITSGSAPMEIPGVTHMLENWRVRGLLTALGVVS